MSKILISEMYRFQQSIIFSRRYFSSMFNDAHAAVSGVLRDIHILLMCTFYEISDLILYAKPKISLSNRSQSTRGTNQSVMGFSWIFKLKYHWNSIASSLFKKEGWVWAVAQAVEHSQFSVLSLTVWHFQEWYLSKELGISQIVSPGHYHSKVLIS